MTASRFHRQFKRIAAPNLLAQFGESVVYHPSGGTARTITALVERSQETEFQIRVRNSSCNGISSGELDTGGDEIAFPLRIGEAAVRRSIVALSDDSNGMTRVICK